MSGMLIKTYDLVPGLWVQQFFVVDPNTGQLAYHSKQKDPDTLLRAITGGYGSGMIVKSYTNIEERGGMSRKFRVDISVEVEAAGNNKVISVAALTLQDKLKWITTLASVEASSECGTDADQYHILTNSTPAETNYTPESAVGNSKQSTAEVEETSSSTTAAMSSTATNSSSNASSSSTVTTDLFTCPQCYESFKRSEDLVEHFEQQHIPSAPSPAGPTRAIVDLCMHAYQCGCISLCIGAHPTLY